MIAEEVRTKQGARGPRPLRRARARKSASGEAAIELLSPDDGPSEVTARLVDVSDYGVGFETEIPLSVGSSVVISSRFFDSTAKAARRRKARIIHCGLRADNYYRSGACFEETTAAPGTANAQEINRAARGLFVDYYEALQISPHADPEMIERAYRVLMERYVSDAAESRHEDVVRLIEEAHRVLSDPERRAAYDVKHQSRSLHSQIVASRDEVGGPDEEKRIRRGILSVLYKAQRKQAAKQGFTARELEDLLLCPRERLEFALWYLRGKSQVAVTGHERYVITPRGVDTVESGEEQTLATPRLLLTAAPLGQC